MAHAADRAGIQWRTLERVARARRCARRAARPIACCTRRRSAALVETQPNLDAVPAGGRRPDRRGRPRRRRASRRSGLRVPRARRRADGRHLPRRQDPRRPDATTRPAAPAIRRRRALARKRCASCRFAVGRLKTGTPPRIDGRTHRLSRRCDEQPGDDPAPVFSFLGSRDEHPRQVQLLDHAHHASARTTSSAARSTARRCTRGVIEGVGPRYCPSIEDKVVRFADKASHQIFIEPEGLDTHEIYPNGISTSLPFDVQLDARALDPRLRARAHHAAGLRDRVRLLRSARAQGRRSRPRPIAGLYLRRPDQRHHRLRGGRRAGPGRRPQRRARRRRTRRRGTPRRDEAYIGVLIDDLVTQRHDRAVPHVHLARRIPAAPARGQRRPAPDRDRPRARRGAAGALRRAARKRDAVERETAAPARAVGGAGQCARRARSNASSASRVSRETQCAGSAAPARTRLRRARRASTARPGGRRRDDVAEQVEVQAKYAGYLERQREEIDAPAPPRSTPRFPAGFDYDDGARPVGRGAGEARSACARKRSARPQRISGVTPAAISLLLVHLKRRDAA